MPNHDIPEPYCWDESFRVFYAQIDDEHKGLFQGIFACAGDRGSKAKLDSLAALVKAHFDAEEAMMVSKNYSNYTSHKALHDKFLKDLGGLSVPLSDANVDFAKKWLVDHIKDIDFQYKGKLD